MDSTPICDAVARDLGLPIGPLLEPRQPWKFEDADRHALEQLAARADHRGNGTHGTHRDPETQQNEDQHGRQHKARG